VHYAPAGYNGIPQVDRSAGEAVGLPKTGTVEVDRIVQFLKEHDNLARKLAAEAKQFATTHLVREGRYCYIKVGRGRVEPGRR